LNKGLNNGHATVRLDEECACEWLVIVEREIDCLTLEAYGIPALSVPGTTKYTTDVYGFTRLFIVREPGEGGKKFVAAIIELLYELAFTGEAFVIDLQATFEAVSFHVPDSGFLAFWQRAIESASPVVLEDEFHE
jgi:hypothetical protein